MTKYLMKKFVIAWRRTEDARWECAEIAQLVLVQDGNAGIEELAHAVHVSVGVVREMANVAQRIPPTVREKFKDMPWGHFVAVHRAREHFAPGSSESDPAWWLAHAKNNNWTRNALRTAYRNMHNHKDEAAPMVDRAAWLLARSQEAENHYQRIVVEIERFNQDDGPYFGTLNLTLERIEAEPDLLNAS